MKNNLLLFTLLLFLIAGCNKQSPTQTGENNGSEECNSPTYNDSFKKITVNTTLAQLNELFGSAGDNFRNDVSGSTTINYYKWYPCSNKGAFFVECRFMGGQLILSNKSISDNSCSNNVSSTSFSSITLGMTYGQVKSIMNEDGDLYRTDYNYPAASIQILYYRFYDCSNASKYIEVRLRPVEGVISTNKTF